VKYVDDLVLLPKEEAVLQGMIERLTENGRCCGMEVFTTVALFQSGSRHVRFVVDKVALRQVFCQVLWLLCARYSTSTAHSFIYSLTLAYLAH
jgi:hypothetical protein